MTTQSDVIKAASDVARRAAEGTLKPGDLDTELVEKCRTLFGRVAGDGDPLFELQVAVANQVLATGAIAASTLREWAAVARQRAQGGETSSGGTDHPGIADPALREACTDESRVKE